MNNPHVQYHKDLMKGAEKEWGCQCLDYQAYGTCSHGITEPYSVKCMSRLQKWLTSQYLHQLEEEVKRLRGKKKEELPFRYDDNEHYSMQRQNGIGFNNALDSELALLTEAIKEIKAL